MPAKTPPPAPPQPGREVRFRIIGRPQARLLHLSCNGCAHEFLVRLTPENRNFTCWQCRVVGNLPGVLLSEIDRLDISPKERQIRIDRVVEAFQEQKVV